MKRRRKLIKLASFLALGSLITQASACYIIGANTLVSGAAGALLDENGKFLGLINVCGIPDVVTVDANGVASDVQNAQDDLFTGCPIKFIQE